MPLQIIQDNLVNMLVDAIVNTSNPTPAADCSVDMGIHQKAGPELLIARKELGTLPVGGAGITDGYDLPAKHVIYTVFPIWQGGDKGEVQLLTAAYTNSLHTALEAGCESVAFPLMAADDHDFPKQIALQTAVDAISRFLMEHDMTVYLVVFSRDSVVLSETLFHSIESYIDENYIHQEQTGDFDFFDLIDDLDLDSLFSSIPMACDLDSPKLEVSEPAPEYQEASTSVVSESDAWDLELLDIDTWDFKALESDPASEDDPWDSDPWGYATSETEVWYPEEYLYQDYYGQSDGECASDASFGYMEFMDSTFSLDDLTDLLDHTDAGFSETLLQLIDRSGKTDPEVYKRANIDRKLFSKIRSSPDYRPTKPTVLAFAIALELDLEETEMLLSRAGFALSHASKFDIIVEYFIKNKKYNIHELNQALFAFDLTPIGEKL